MKINVKIGPKEDALYITLEDEDLVKESIKLNAAKVKAKLLIAAAHAKVDLDEKDMIDFPEDLIGLKNYEVTLRVPEKIQLFGSCHGKDAVNMYLETAKIIKENDLIDEFLTVTEKIVKLLQFKFLILLERPSILPAFVQVFHSSPVWPLQVRAKLNCFIQ